MTAYELIDRLRDQDPGLRAPPVVYRVLARLIELGKVHRLEARNAFVACNARCRAPAAAVAEETPTLPFLALCRACGQVEEWPAPDLSRLARARASDEGFNVARMALEVEGYCPDCRDPEDPAAPAGSGEDVAVAPT